MIFDFCIDFRISSNLIVLLFESQLKSLLLLISFTDLFMVDNELIGFWLVKFRLRIYRTSIFDTSWALAEVDKEAFIRTSALEMRSSANFRLPRTVS